MQRNCSAISGGRVPGDTAGFFSAVPFHELAGLEEAAERVKPLVLEQLKSIEPSACGDIVFVSKSLGTVCAGWLEKEWGVPARQLYLTPLPQTLDCIRETSRVAEW